MHHFHSLHLLFVMPGPAGDRTAADIAAGRSFVTPVMSATLAGIMLHHPCGPDEINAL